MNDIVQFFVGLSDGFRDALSDVNPLAMLVVAILIGLFQSKTEKLGLKAAAALFVVYGFTIFYPVLSGHDPHWPDFRHIGPIVQVVVLYVLGYGLIGALGSLKAAMSKPAAKPAH